MLNKKKKVEDVIEHVITEKDLERNPGSDLIVGETVEIPAVPMLGLFKGEKVLGSPERITIDGRELTRITVESGVTYTVTDAELKEYFK